MTFSTAASQMLLLLTAALVNSVSSQQATAPADANTLFTSLLTTSNVQGQPQQPIGPNAFSTFGTPGSTDVSGGLGNPSFQSFPMVMMPRSLPPSFPTSNINTIPRPLPQPSMISQNLLPLALFPGSDMGQAFAMAHVFGGAGGRAGGTGSGILGNPFLLYSFMNSF